MGIITDILSTILLLLYSLLGQNVALAIVAFTVIIRLSILPLTIKQQRSLKKMQELSPKLKELQKKYKDDREKMTQAQMALYREHGVNPFAGCLPLLIQLPILFGLWRAIIATLASSPRQLLELQDRILIGGLDHLVPLKNSFLWLNLALPDPYYVLPVLVVITTYVQQKMIIPAKPKTERKQRKPGDRPDPTDQAEQMTRSMTTIMPLLFGFFALSYSSGLSLYFITSNIIGIVQYSAMGKADIRRLFGKEPPAKEEDTPQPAKTTASDNGHTIEEEVVEQAMAANERQLKPGITVTRLKGGTSSASARRSTASSNSKSQRTGSSQRGTGKRSSRSRQKTKSRSKR